MLCSGSGLDPDLNGSVDSNPARPKKRKSIKFFFVIEKTLVWMII
jgi:hypothetical protein